MVVVPKPCRLATQHPVSGSGEPVWDRLLPTLHSPTRLLHQPYASPQSDRSQDKALIALLDGHVVEVDVYSRSPSDIDPMRDVRRLRERVCLGRTITADRACGGDTARWRAVVRRGFNGQLVWWKKSSLGYGITSTSSSCRRLIDDSETRVRGLLT